MIKLATNINISMCATRLATWRMHRISDTYAKLLLQNGPITNSVRNEVVREVLIKAGVNLKNPEVFQVYKNDTLLVAQINTRNGVDFDYWLVEVES
jgi:hypothetical protein